MKMVNHKFSKKYYKKALNFLKEYGDAVKVSSTPTPHLFLGNGGMLCDRERQQVFHLFSGYGAVVDLVMIPNKSYSFISYSTVECANRAVDELNSYAFDEKAGGPVAPLYLFYLQDAFPSGVVPLDNVYPTLGKPDFINDLLLDEGVLNELYEQELIEYFQIADSSVLGNATPSTLKNRRVKHFGYEFLYGTNNIDRAKPLELKIPDICTPLLEKLLAKNLIKHMPDQLTVNQYEVGQGIPPHVDTHSAFEDEILSITLGHQVVMDFTSPQGRKVSLILPRRSALVMSGESRYLWTHGIVPRSHDIYYIQDSNIDNATKYHLTSAPRGLRISLTFRKILHQPCTCSFPEKCDSQLRKEDSLFVPNTFSEASMLETHHVYDVYEEIAEHFSDTRHTAWPRIKQFLCDLPAGSLLADVGCGNGKYLGVNENVVSIGCDRSMNLLTICKERKHEVHTADCLSLPYRSSVFDATICIAVVHHLSTRERRLDAIKELVRITRVCGSILLSVWALEQNFDQLNLDSGNCQDNKTSSEEIDRLLTSESVVSPQETEMVPSSQSSRERIEVSEGRYEFQQQDLLIPWHKKSTNKCEGEVEKVYHRFYHVFKQGELQSLCEDVANVELSQLYFDKGNWCVILKKIRE